MRGLSYLSILCLVTITLNSYAFEAQSPWGAVRAPTPLNRDRLTSVPSERDSRAVSMYTHSAHEVLLSSPSKQRTQEWVVEPRVQSEQRMMGDRTSLKRDICACIFVCGIVAFMTWIFMQQNKAH